MIIYNRDHNSDCMCSLPSFLLCSQVSGVTCGSQSWLENWRLHWVDGAGRAAWAQGGAWAESHRQKAGGLWGPDGWWLNCRTQSSVSCDWYLLSPFLETVERNNAVSQSFHGVEVLCFLDMMPDKEDTLQLNFPCITVNQAGFIFWLIAKSPSRCQQRTPVAYQHKLKLCKSVLLLRKHAERVQTYQSSFDIKNNRYYNMAFFLKKHKGWFFLV